MSRVICRCKLSKYGDSGRILGRAVSKLYAKNPEMTNVKRRRKIGRRPGQSRDQKMPRWTNSYFQKRPKGTTGVPNCDQTGTKMAPHWAKRGTKLRSKTIIRIRPKWNSSWDPSATKLVPNSNQNSINLGQTWYQALTKNYYQNGTKMELKLEPQSNQTGTKIQRLEPKWNQNGRTGTKIEPKYENMNQFFDI